MAVTFNNVGAVAHGNNASVTPGLPASIGAGVALLVFAAIRNSGTGEPVRPAGYTTILSFGNMALFGKISTGTESAPTIAFTGGVANATTSAQMASFSNVASLTPIAAATLLNASAQNISTPAVAVPAAGALVLYLGWKQDDWTSVANLVDGYTDEIGEPFSVLGDDQGIVWDRYFPATKLDIFATSFIVTGGASAISRGAVVVLPPKQVAPTVTNVQDVYPPRVVVLTSLAAASSVQLYRVVGGVRTLVRGATSAADAGPNFVRVDAELPFGVPVSYMAVIDGIDSPNTTPVTYSLPGGKVALSDAVSGLSAEATILAWPDRSYQPPSSTFKVGGRNVVVSGELGMFEGTIELYTETTSTRDNLWNLLRNTTQGIIQMRQPGGYDGVDSYLVVVDAKEQRWSQDGSDQRRRHVLQVVETSSWASALEAAGFTLQDIADTYSGQTLQDFSDDFATLLQVATIGEFGV